MNGEALRAAASSNDVSAVMDMLIARCNVCSADEYGLTALHFAVWNGHVECVKFLVTNPVGVDKRGNRSSTLQAKTCMGYTALHLAALDCPPRSAHEVTTLLLLAGVDANARSSEEDKTALELAQQCSNEPFLAAVDEFKSAATDRAVHAKLLKLRDTLLESYRYQENALKRAAVQELDVGFELPGFLFAATTTVTTTVATTAAGGEASTAVVERRRRMGNMPEELLIHEQHIRPLTEAGFYDLKGLQQLKCLQFSDEQAQANKLRRDRLMASSDPTFTPARSTL